MTKRALNPTVTLMEVEAPHIARKAKAGQFIIFRVDEQGERVPLTIADYDRERGTVTIIFQHGEPQPVTGGISARDLSEPRRTRNALSHEALFAPA